MRWLLALALVAGCAGNFHANPYAPKFSGTSPGASGVPDARCAGTPQTGRAEGFRFRRHWLVTQLARPDHRGYDLVVSNTDAQVLSGKLAYGVVDKSLEHEDVDLYACVAGAWQSVGRTRTNESGEFSLALDGANRLPDGLRDLYGSVVGDRTGFHFLAYVAPAGSHVVVSDVDGTLTSAESSFIKAVFLDRTVDAQPGAADALRLAAASGYQVVYVTARSQRFTDATRQWLADHGFPRGPVRLAPTLITTPGAPTVAYKRGAMRSLSAFDVRAIGNRKTDIAAYTQAGIPADHIFIKLPEFGGELSTSLREGAAIGFGHYSDFKSAL